MINSIYISQLNKCNELNLERKKMLSSFRLIKALVIERRLKREILKLKILEEIKREIDKYKFTVTESQRATLRRFNHAFDKKSG